MKKKIKWKERLSSSHCLAECNVTKRVMFHQTGSRGREGHADMQICRRHAWVRRRQQYLIRIKIMSILPHIMLPSSISVNELYLVCIILSRLKETKIKCRIFFYNFHCTMPLALNFRIVTMIGRLHRGFQFHLVVWPQAVDVMACFNASPLYTRFGNERRFFFLFFTCWQN